MRILIIEDDAKIAEFVADGFRQSGYNVQVAGDGETGLAALLQGGFDAAIVDIMLPKKDGLSIIKEIRSKGDKVPVIFLSARGSVDAKIAGFEAGGDDYLAKPFSIAELIVRVQALTRRNGGSVWEANILKVADLEMDLTTHRVTRGETRIELQPLEYQLLEYLMRNHGRVITKTVIMDRVWDYRFNPHTNVVESRICHLREKIDANNEVKLIHTIRGFGYVLEAR